MDEPSVDIKELYLAIGYVITQWSFVESALDVAVSTIYIDYGGRSLCKQMPKFLKDKSGFIVKAVSTIPQLAPFKRAAENLTGRIMNNKDYREDFAHSCLTSPTDVNGVFSFSRLNARQHDHSEKIWTFDVRNFPKISETLQGLVVDSQTFAMSLQVAFDK